MRSTPSDGPDPSAQHPRSREALWQERRAQLIAELGPQYSEQYPHLTPRSLIALVEKEVDTKLLHLRFGHES